MQFNKYTYIHTYIHTLYSGSLSMMVWSLGHGTARPANKIFSKVVLSCRVLILYCCSTQYIAFEIPYDTSTCCKYHMIPSTSFCHKYLYHVHASCDRWSIGSAFDRRWRCLICTKSKATCTRQPRQTASAVSGSSSNATTVFIYIYGHHIWQSMDQPVKVANPARGQLNRENEYSLVPVRA